MKSIWFSLLNFAFLLTQLGLNVEILIYRWICVKTGASIFGRGNPFPWDQCNLLAATNPFSAETIKIHHSNKKQNATPFSLCSVHFHNWQLVFRTYPVFFLCSIVIFYLSICFDNKLQMHRKWFIIHRINFCINRRNKKEWSRLNNNKIWKKNQSERTNVQIWFICATYK